MREQYGLPRDDVLAEKWLNDAMTKIDASNGVKIMAGTLLKKLKERD